MNRQPAAILHNRWTAVASAWRAWWLRRRGIAIGRDCRIGANAEVEPGFFDGRSGQVSIGNASKIESSVVLHAYGGVIDIGERVFLGPATVIYGHGGVRIGPDTLIAMHCRIVSANHAIPPKETLINSLPDIRLPITIGRDVWLAAGVTVLGGVTIGDGVVVGAGSVVTSDLPPYSVAMGVPARVVRERA